MRFEVASVDSFVVYLGSEISDMVAKKVRKLYLDIKAKNPEGILELTPSYTSLLVRFDPFSLGFEEAKTLLSDIYKNQAGDVAQEKENILEVPVLYDKEVGLDLEALSREKGVSTQELIEWHSQKSYRVYALGFLPGFAYMGSVDEKLASPRHENPRTAIPKGSVGIAENQTAIYPKKSPGGWKILGRTPLELFSKKYKGLSFFHVGDMVRFVPIDKEEFLRLGGKL